MNDKFIPMTCSSCGGKLQISPSVTQFVCGYCLTEFTIKREGGTIALAPLEETVKKVEENTSLVASELAITRLKGEITQITNRYNEIFSAGTNNGKLTINFALNPLYCAIRAMSYIRDGHTTVPASAAWLGHNVAKLSEAFFSATANQWKEALIFKDAYRRGDFKPAGQFRIKMTDKAVARFCDTLEEMAGLRTRIEDCTRQLRMHEQIVNAAK